MTCRYYRVKAIAFIYGVHVYAVHASIMWVATPTVSRSEKKQAYEIKL
jgi:hypothetical protein